MTKDDKDQQTNAGIAAGMVLQTSLTSGQTMLSHGLWRGGAIFGGEGSFLGRNPHVRGCRVSVAVTETDKQAASAKKNILVDFFFLKSTEAHCV